MTHNENPGRLLGQAGQTGGRLLAILGRKRRLAIVEVAAIFVADTVLRRDELPVVVAAGLDEPAHLATAALLLAAAPAPVSPCFMSAALVGSVAIDLDHLPELLGRSEPSDHRPATHSALTVALLASLTLTLPVRWRTGLSGLATGVTLHLLRDLATGGAPLAVPLSRRVVHLPYVLYAAMLVGATARIMKGTCHAA